MSEFSEKMKTLAAEVEEELTACFMEQFDSPDIIISAMKYSLFVGGKRLRPVLMKETCHCLGGDSQMVVKLACALEMIHTYSLIHDDLPAMDDDDLRRGEPTNHKVYGESIAILAGDALLNYAVETALAGVPNSETEAMTRYIRALQILFYASGVNGMIGGQTGDILCEEDGEVTEEKLAYIHAHKTGALIKASVLCGAVIAGAKQSELAALEDYADAIGLAFQIVDDILDVTGTEESLGKPIGSDEKNHKTTFVSLYGLASSEVKVGELEVRALKALDCLDHDTTFLRELATYICTRAN
ncbi:polyprenyl synthetase family protein [Eubacterium sp.]|uniref:polyprenyl synthetase family protein n=1 Tax=Eubacterium sp. TaxID=142586 RepID=UPI002FCA6562